VSQELWVPKPGGALPRRIGRFLDDSTQTEQLTRNQTGGPISTALTHFLSC
jgi:hypothetical protein